MYKFSVNGGNLFNRWIIPYTDNPDLQSKFALIAINVCTVCVKFTCLFDKPAESTALVRSPNIIH